MHPSNPSDQIPGLSRQYNSTITELIDKHAPLITRVITIRQKTPWFSEGLSEAKRQLRRAERRWRQSRLTVHRDMFTSLRDTYRHELITTKSAYFCDKIQESTRNMKSMYRVANDLMGRKQSRTLPEHHCSDEVMADRFLEHFSDKITSIRQRLNQPSDAQPTRPAIDNECGHTLSEFSPANTAATCRLIQTCPSKHCSLDPLPTSLLKANVNVIAPTLTRIINLSLESATVPADMKSALITPVLKKTSLDSNELMNYRPISNLSFVSKLLERHIAADLRCYIDENTLLDPFQSAYRPRHSTETALVRIHDDIMQALDRKKGVILVLLDLTAAFDTVDHSMLLQQLYSIGIRESALAWLTSYLSDRTLAIKIGDVVSRQQRLDCGIPQGSVLGPLLFTIYCMPISSIFAKHGVNYHMYADDTQLYVEFPRNRPTDAENAAHRIGNCVTDLKRWLTDHQLLLNESKTEAIAFNVPSCKVPPAITDINICGCDITLQQTVRDIGVVLDSGLDMSAQVSRMCQSAYFQLHNIAKIRHCLTVNACKTIVHALVTSKLDYGNAVLFGINGRLLNKLQMTQNSAARLIMRQRRRDHITPVLIALHWLPIRFRVMYKLLVLTFLAIHNLAPAYITDLISIYEPGRQLRSASRALLAVPHHNLERFGRRGFSVNAPRLWNDLPDNLRVIDSVVLFKRHLKTHLFKAAFSDYL